MPYTISWTESDAVCELLTPEGQSIATVEASHAPVLAMAPDMLRCLERIASSDPAHSRFASLVMNEVRELLGILEEMEGGI